MVRLVMEESSSSRQDQKTGTLSHQSWVGEIQQASPTTVMSAPVRLFLFDFLLLPSTVQADLQLWGPRCHCASVPEPNSDLGASSALSS